MVGFNLCFFPMHFLGFYGLPRRVCVYDPSFFWLKNISSLGGLFSVIRAIFLVFIIWESLVVNKKVINLWGSSSVVMNVVTIPVPHHCIYMSCPVRWLPLS